MKVLVSCDEWCYKYNGDYYLRDFGHVLVNRYLMVFDEVRFVVRTKNISSFDHLGKFKEKVVDPRIEIYEIPFFQGPKQYVKVYFDTKKAVDNIHKGCDLAILRLPSTTAFAVWKSIRKRIPYATELVADGYDLYRNAKSFVNKSLWRILNREMKSACENAIGISCVTHFYMQSHYSSKIPNFVTSHYSSIEMLPEFRYKSRSYPEKDCIDVILVTNKVYLNSEKGHKLAVNVLKELSDIEVDVKLTLVGEDYFGGIQQIKDYAESLGVLDKITFTGFINTSKLKEYLKKSDILILPTEAEGLPRVIIEGMALGLPCVTTRVSGNPELIDKEFLLDYNDVKGFADRISKLINNKEIYESQSKINFERSREYCKDVLDERRKQFFMDLKNIIK